MTIAIPTHNNYVDLVKQDQPTNHAVETNQSKNNEISKRVQSSHVKLPSKPTGIDSVLPTPQSPQNDNCDITGNMENSNGKRSSSIDSMLSLPQSPIINSYVVGTDEVQGGMEGNVREEHTNLQERESKGGVCLMLYMRILTLALGETLEPLHLFSTQKSGSNWECSTQVRTTRT